MPGSMTTSIKKEAKSFIYITRTRPKTQRVISNLTNPMLISVVYELTKKAALHKLLCHPEAARTEILLRQALDEAVKRNLTIVQGFKK